MICKPSTLCHAMVALLLYAGSMPAAWSQAEPAGPVPVANLATSAAAGTIKRSTGTATLERAGQGQAVAIGAKVQVGDVLRTGADGAVGITLSDDTLLTLGASSELVITTYSFDATTHEGQLLASLWRGTLGVITGLIGKKAPEKVNVQTRTVVLGVRGTEFLVDAGRGAP